MKIRLSPSGDTFLISPDDGSRTELEVAINATGARAIADILLAQRLTPRPRIGTAAFPTQAQLNQFLSSRELERLAKFDEEWGDLEIDL